MTSLSTPQVEPATGTADAGRPAGPGRTYRATPGGGVPDPAQRPAEWGGAGAGLHRAGARRRRCAGRGVPRPAALPAPRTRTGRGGTGSCCRSGTTRSRLYAALAEAGIIPVEELETYGSDDSRLPMSGMASYTPGMEISGGSLGHGLTVATGMALGLRHLGNPARVYQPALRRRARRGLHVGGRTGLRPPRAGQRDRDRRRQRPAGRRPHRGDAADRAGADKWQAFGWKALRVDGNDVAALVDAFDELRAHKGSPSVLICDTRIGSGVPLLETREKAHFMRVDEHEWQIARDQLDGGHTEPMTTSSDHRSTPKLTTSAMIASFADPGQKTTQRPVRARAGQARRGAPGDRRAVGRPG